MAQLAAELQAYPDPEDYPGAFEANVRAVAGIEPARPALAALVASVASATGLLRAEVLIDLQRYILNAHEYQPSQLVRQSGRRLSNVLKLLLAARPLRSRNLRNADVIIDDWYPGALDAFYGEELLAAVARRGRVTSMNLTGVRRAGPLHALRALSVWVRAVGLVRAAARTEGVDLTVWLRVVLTNWAVGRSLASAGSAHTIVTGNDNGFPHLRARAAGMQLVSIENGVRRRVSDSAFVRTDVFAAMAAGRVLEMRKEIGCRFDAERPLGSLRLARHLAAEVSVPEPTADVLFVSSLEGDEFDLTFRHYNMRFEREAISHVNALAEGSDLRVAYYPRSNAELETLRALGLWSDAVDYRSWRPRGVYAAVETAAVVLSTCSTVSLEALALGRPGGYVNVSGNTELNPGGTWAGLDWTPSGGTSLADFVAELRQREIPRAEFIVQAAPFFERLAELLPLTSAR